MKATNDFRLPQKSQTLDAKLTLQYEYADRFILMFTEVDGFTRFQHCSQQNLVTINSFRPYIELCQKWGHDFVMISGGN
jgi:hypothetical protein